MNRFLLPASFSLFCYIVFMTMDAHEFSNRVFLTSLFIQIFSIFKLFEKQNIPFSLRKIFYLFSLFFFGVSPLIQFYKNASQWGRTLSEDQYFIMNIIIIIVLVSYECLYTLIYKVKFQNYKMKRREQRLFTQLSIPNSLNTKQNIIIITLSLISFFVIFWFNNFSVYSLFVRGGEFKEFVELSDSNTTSKSLVIGNFFRPLSMMCLLYYILLPKKNIIILVILLLSAIATCFPLSMARFSVATLYIPLLLISVPLFWKKNVFVISFIAGLLIIFPFLNSFRNVSQDTKIKIGLDFEMFVEGHFDSYANAAQVIFNDIITNGYQLWGVMFFWIPRSIWPEKPIGSGAYLSEQIGLTFDNIALNYFGEGYINGGFIGVLLFTFILAYITASFDKLYWTNKIKANNVLYLAYLLFLGLIFFILRGDLLSSTAYTIGFFSSMLFLHFLLKFARSKKGQNL